MKNVRAIVYLDGIYNDYLLDEICEKTDGADYWYGRNYVKYVGSGEGLEHLKRVLKINGFKIKETKT